MKSNFASFYRAILFSVAFIPFFAGAANQRQLTETPQLPNPEFISNPSSVIHSDLNTFPSCITSDSDHLCIGLKIVSYENNGVPILNESQAITLVSEMNTIWSQCNIGFQIEVFQTVNPLTLGLPYSPDWTTGTNAIRKTFGERGRFLIAAVGSESGPTIAVTMMPNSGIYGTVVDSNYAKNPLTVGHELGHYQGLFHVTDGTNIMNPYIGPATRSITPSQCTTARNMDKSDWSAMLR